MRDSLSIIDITKVIFITLFLTSCGGETSQSPEIEEQPSQPQEDEPLIIPPIYTDSELVDLTDNILIGVAIAGERSAITQDNTAKILHAYERSFEVVTQAVMKLLTYPDTQYASMFQNYYYWQNIMDDYYTTGVVKGSCSIIDLMDNYQGVSIRHDACFDDYKGETYSGDEVIRVTYEDDEIIKFESSYSNLETKVTDSISNTVDGNFQLTISKSTRKLEKVIADFAVNYPDIGLIKFNDFQIVTDSWSSSTKFNYKKLKSVEGLIEVEGIGSFNLKTAHAFDKSITIPALRFQFSGSTDSLAHLDVTDNYDYTFGFDVDGDSYNDFSTIFELYPSSTHYDHYYYDLDIRSDNTTNPLFIENNLKSYTVIGGVEDEIAFYISAYGIIGTPFVFDMSNFFRGVSGKLFTYEVNAYPIRARDVKRFPQIATSHYTDNIESAFSFAQVEPGVIEFNVTSPFEEITYNVEVFPIGMDGERIGETVTVRVIVNNDNDGDGILDDLDSDDDNDGVYDGSDAFILDASEQKDTDGDFIGNNEDLDDDNDGYLDVDDFAPLDFLCALPVQVVDDECAGRKIERGGEFVDKQGVYYYYLNSSPLTQLLRWDVQTEEFLSPIAINRDEILASPLFDIAKQDSYPKFYPEQNRLYVTYYDSGIISMIDFNQVELKEVIFYIDENESVGEIYDYSETAIVYREAGRSGLPISNEPSSLIPTLVDHKLINLIGEIVDVKTQENIGVYALERYTRIGSAPYCPYGFTFDNETHEFYNMELDYNYWVDNPCYHTDMTGRYVHTSPDKSRAFKSGSGAELMDSEGNVLITDIDLNFINEDDLVWNRDDFYLISNNVIKRYDYDGIYIDKMTLPERDWVNDYSLLGHNGEYLVIKAWGWEYSKLYAYKADE